MIERTFTGKDETGLEITVVTTEYTDFPVAEIVAYFRGGAQNTPVLRDILAFDGKFRGRRPVLYHNTGDYYSSNGYETRSELMEPNFQTHMNFAPTGGRACDEAFPYFKLQCEGFGLNIAVGWPAPVEGEFPLDSRRRGHAGGPGNHASVHPAGRDHPHPAHNHHGV